MKKLGIVLSIVFTLLLPHMVIAQQQSWSSWVAQVRQEALAQGISPSVFDAAFADVHEPSKQIKGLARSQPDGRLTYSKYLHSRVDAYRIAIGRKEYKKNQALLDVAQWKVTYQ